MKLANALAVVMLISSGYLGGGLLACSGPSGSPREGGADGGGNDAARKDVSVDAPSEKDAHEDRRGARDGDAGPPSLVSLSVSAPDSDASPAVTLWPPFSPEIYDYSVTCPDAENTLTVSMKASRGAESLLIQPTLSGSLPEQTLKVKVGESQAIVAVATDAVTTAEYWVRCLPHDFPTFQWELHAEAGAPSPGYYLLGVARPPPISGRAYAFILDRHGAPIWYGPSSSGDAVFDVDNVVPGAVSYLPLPHAGFEIRQLSPLNTTSAEAADASVDEHELRYLSNGDFLGLSTALVSGVDLTGARVASPDGGTMTLSGPQTIVSCKIMEFTTDGTIVWMWSASDHIDPVKETAWVQQLGSYFDVFHCNSIDVDPANGNLLVSARQMNSVFYVDRSTGNILWKMGGAVYSKDGALHVAVADPFIAQHDARLHGWSQTCSGGSGQVSVFDDETNTSARARGVLYDVSIAAADGGLIGCDAGAMEAGALEGGAEGGATDGGAADGGAPDSAIAGTATVAWEYRGPTWSAAMGSFRISADGTRVIGWGEGPGGPHGFTEVDEAKNVLLHFTFTNGDVSYRAIKVPPSAFALAVLRDTAGLP